MKDYSDKWWFPVLCDEKWYKRIREDYPEMAHESDEYLHDYYNDQRKYSILWDHVGEAYAEYEKLADAYLELLNEVKKAGKQHLEDNERGNDG